MDRADRGAWCHWMDDTQRIVVASGCKHLTTMNMVDVVAKTFREKFHREPIIIAAPGRINFIGEHTDYNEGFVMPAAIDRHIFFAMAPNDHDKCNIYAADLGEGASFLMQDLSPGGMWLNYLMGVIDTFQRYGKKLRGVDCVFGGNIPLGAGLSSSAALCSGFAFGLNTLFQCGFDRHTLAKIAQRSEHEFAGLMCGIMDMYASLFGEANSALLLDCRTERHESLPVNLGDLTILLVDSKVKHLLAASAYNDRRASCEEGVALLHRKYPGVNSLRDVTPLMLMENQDVLGEEVFMKCQYVVMENERTLHAADALRRGDTTSFGKLMYETHWGLSQVYDVSCEELDWLVALAEEEKDKIVGCRMMGGGFGGCTINLLPNTYTGAFSEKVRNKYFATFKKEPDFYQVNLSQGVHQVKN